MDFVNGVYAANGQTSPELCGDPTGANNGWFSADSGVTISGGKFNWTATAADYAIYRTNTLSIGATYSVTYTIDSISGSVGTQNMGGVQHTTPGTYTDTFVATSTTFRLDSKGASTTAVLDNISLKGAAVAAMPGYTYTRSGAKSELNGSGSPVAFAANTPGVVSGLGYWARSAITNLAAHSQDFTQNWQTILSSVSGNVATAPDGTPTADKLIPDTSSGSHSVYNGANFGTGTFTFSVFAKAHGYPRIGLRVYDGAVYRMKTTFELTGSGSVISTPVGETASIQSVGNGWYRCTVIATGASSGMGSINGWNIESLPAGYLCYDAAYSGDGTSGTLLWQAQIMAGAFLDGGPIITTAAASAALGADALRINQTAMTDVDQLVFVTLNKPNLTSAMSSALEISDGTANNAWLLGYVAGGNQWAFYSYAGGVAAALNTVPATAGEVTLVMRRLSGVTRAGKVQGGVLTWTGGTTTQFPTGLTQVRPGHGPFSGTAPLDGGIKKVVRKVGTFTSDADVIAAVS